MLLIFFATILLHVFNVRSTPDLEIIRTCEPISIKTCNDIGYNITGMPNFVGNDLQRDADAQLQTFTPLIQYGCSSRLKFFLCSVYAPMCTEKVPQPIGPCRPLCESVKVLCEPVLVEFGFKWPDALNCSQFPPANNEKHMCMEGPEKEEKTQIPFRERHPSIRTNFHRGSVSRVRHQYTSSSFRTSSPSKCRHLRAYDRYHYINGTGRCAPGCHADILYSAENKQFAQVWIGVWAGLCFLSTGFTLFKFFTNINDFRYSEKVIVIISCCYFIYSIAFFVQLIGGRENTACYWDKAYTEPLLKQGGMYNLNCTIVFTLLYFFGMASTLWWVILTLIWFLTAGLRWSTEHLERYSIYFHLLAWLLPAAKTISILVMQLVDADELTGICYVGNQDYQAMVHFVIVPSVTYFSLGIILLFAGMIAIIKNNRYQPKSQGEEKWEVLMVRIGIFAILYTVPALCVLVANIYEYTTKDQWLAVNSTTRPNVEIFTLKIFMCLVVGITTGVWLYTSKVPRFKGVNLNISSKFCRRRRASSNNPQNSVLLLEDVQPKMTNV